MCIEEFYQLGKVGQRSRQAIDFFADELFSELTGALLATGDYSRRLSNERIHLFGSSNLRAWSELFAGAGRDKAKETRGVLGVFLDAISPMKEGMYGALTEFQAKWFGQKRGWIGVRLALVFCKISSNASGLVRKICRPRRQLSITVVVF
jgi:hypothetical protein